MCMKIWESCLQNGTFGLQTGRLDYKRDSRLTIHPDKKDKRDIDKKSCQCYDTDDKKSCQNDKNLSQIYGPKKKG